MKRRAFIATATSAVASGILTPRYVNGALIISPAVVASSLPVAAPTPAQLAWQRDELAMFLHFGVNTFTDREWGDGTENPSIFAPTNLDARQWARAARAAGFRSMILTAKHHDGFCLWPTATTTHSVASSPFRNGSGDVVREFVDACRAEGLRAGLYLSPWDRNHPTYGDSARYNDVYAAQLTELLTRYGRLSEVWFDGANGEGPNGKRQQYDWPRVFGIVRRLQPDAVTFSDAGPDVRWCGNEEGRAGDPNWSMVDPSVVTYPGASGPLVIPSLQHGSPTGTAWRPAEADVSIRPGWFYHPADDAKVRTPLNLIDLYFSSVGRNSKLLLNVPPTRDGLLHDTDVLNIRALPTRTTSMFANNLAEGAQVSWRRTGDRTALLDIRLKRPVLANLIRLSEDISRGQSVSRFTVQADGNTIARGSTIGYARIEQFPFTSVRQLRVLIEDAVTTPHRIMVGLHHREVGE